MGYSQAQVIEAFFKGENRRHNASNVFWDGDTLYSYGRHFPLIVKREQFEMPKSILTNSDKYSVSTSGHQSLCISILRNLYPGVHFPRTSFALLNQFGLDSRTVIVVDHTSDIYLSAYRGDDNFDTFKESLPEGGLYYERSDQDGLYARYYHRVGSILLKSNKSFNELTRLENFEDDIFMEPLDKDAPSLLLGSTDESQYFLGFLADSDVTTVDEGFESMKPQEIRGKDNVIRQGEYFFEDIHEESLCKELDRLSRKQGKRWWSLAEEEEKTWPLKRPRNSWDYVRPEHLPHHCVKQVVILDGKVYGRGSVRDREHRRLALTKWNIIRHNRCCISFSNRTVGVGVD